MIQVFAPGTKLNEPQIIVLSWFRRTLQLIMAAQDQAGRQSQSIVHLSSSNLHEFVSLKSAFGGTSLIDWTSVFHMNSGRKSMKNHPWGLEGAVK